MKKQHDSPSGDSKDINTHERSIMSCRELGKILDLRQAQIRHLCEKHSDFSPANPKAIIPHPVIRQINSKAGFKYEKKAVSFINLKGGVGKTTAAITLASRAAQLGYNIALLDMDPQASASLAFRMEADEEDPIFLDVWKKPEEVIDSSLKKISSGFSLLPSSLENSLLDTSLSNPRHQKSAVKAVVDSLFSRGFDLVFIDCPPSLGTAVVSSICASDLVVIPINNDPFSAKGLELTIQEIDAICDAFGIDIPERKVIFNRYDRRERMTDEAWGNISKKYSKLLHKKPIGTSTLFSRALDQSRTLFDLPVTHHAKEAYDSLFMELIGVSLKTIRKGAHREAK